jgi:hypothetical protein
MVWRLLALDGDDLVGVEEEELGFDGFYWEVEEVAEGFTVALHLMAVGGSHLLGKGFKWLLFPIAISFVVVDDGVVVWGCVEDENAVELASLPGVVDDAVIAIFTPEGAVILGAEEGLSEGRGKEVAF